MQMRYEGVDADTDADANADANELNEMKRLERTSQDEVSLTDNFLRWSDLKNSTDRKTDQCEFISTRGTLRSVYVDAWVRWWIIVVLSS